MTSVYYAHNVFGKLQINLTHDDFLTPAEREVVASGIPLVRAMVCEVFARCRLMADVLSRCMLS